MTDHRNCCCGETLRGRDATRLANESGVPPAAPVAHPRTSVPAAVPRPGLAARPAAAAPDDSALRAAPARLGAAVGPPCPHTPTPTCDWIAKEREQWAQVCRDLAAAFTTRGLPPSGFEQQEDR